MKEGQEKESLSGVWKQTEGRKPHLEPKTGRPLPPMGPLGTLVPNDGLLCPPGSRKLAVPAGGNPDPP